MDQQGYAKKDLRVLYNGWKNAKRSKFCPSSARWIFENIYCYRAVTGGGPLQDRVRPWMAEDEPRMDAAFGVS